MNIITWKINTRDYLSLAWNLVTRWFTYTRRKNYLHTVCACNNEKLFAYLLEKLNEKYDSVRWRFIVKILFLEIFSSTQNVYVITHFLCKFIEENTRELGYFERVFELRSYERSLHSIFTMVCWKKNFFVYELFGGGPAKLGSWKEFN